MNILIGLNLTWIVFEGQTTGHPTWREPYEPYILCCSLREGIHPFRRSKKRRKKIHRKFEENRMFNFYFKSCRIAARWTVRLRNSCVSRIVRWWRVEETKEQTTEFEYDSIINARTVRTVLVTMRSRARGRQCFFFFFSNRSSFPGRFALLSKYDLVAISRLNEILLFPVSLKHVSDVP